MLSIFKLHNHLPCFQTDHCRQLSVVPFWLSWIHFLCFPSAYAQQETERENVRRVEDYALLSHAFCTIHTQIIQVFAISCEVRSLLHEYYNSCYGAEWFRKHRISMIHDIGVNLYFRIIIQIIVVWFLRESVTKQICFLLSVTLA